MSSFFLSLDENEKHDDISRLQHLDKLLHPLLQYRMVEIR